MMDSLINIVKFADSNPNQIVHFYLPEHDNAADLYKLIHGLLDDHSDQYTSDFNYNTCEFSNGSVIGAYKINWKSNLKCGYSSVIYVDTLVKSDFLTSVSTYGRPDCPMIFFEFDISAGLVGMKGAA